ncbi:TetR/AcrR family transcriptional regulator [Rathayibacter sp. CAU 1779]
MGRPRTIDRSAVLAAAMAVADRDGLSAVTTRAVAGELSVSTMAMYRHVRDKDELLDGLVEGVLVELVDGIRAPLADEHLETTVRAFLDAAVAVAVRHPSVFPLLLIRPVVTEASAEVRARVHDLLRRTGVPPGALIAAERATTSTVLGVAAGYATGRLTPAPRDRDLAATSTFVAAGLMSLIEPFIEPSAS